MSGYYAQQNAGKRNVSIDLNVPGARALALRLCDTADVVVENFRARTLGFFGLDYETLAARNPRLIYASITGYGQGGPWQGRMAYAPTVQAEAGFTANSMRHYGEVLGEPRTDSLSHADVYAGLQAAIAILAALHRRETTGKGQYIDISMAATLMAVNERAHVDLNDSDLGAEPAILGATDCPFYTGGVSALVGSFLQAAAQNFGLHVDSLWVIVGVGATLAATYCACRDMRVTARVMLALEGLSVLAILGLSCIIVSKVALETGLPVAPFAPSAEFDGWSGVGYGLVFTVLSFAGFEGATTLGEEVTNPRRSIPIAVAGTVMLAGAFFVFVSYAQVIGHGTDQIAMLGNASAPLNDLAIRYVSRDFATAIDLAAAFSAFACVIGSLSAAARLLFALGRAGLAPRIGEVDASRGTPAAAIVLTGGLCLIGILIWAPFVGAADYYGDLATIGTLALILVYGGVTGAELPNHWTADG